MSITITPENFKKYAKRQQKTLSQFLEEHNRTPSLNESQEILAKTLGFSNYHEYIQKINEPKTSIIKSFIDDLYAIVHKDNSSIQECYINKGYNPHQEHTIAINISVNSDEYFFFNCPIKISKIRNS